MTQQVRKGRSTRPRADEAVPEAVEVKHSPPQQITDEVLDEIDEVLEENAEEFVRAYVQKGGE